MTADGELTIDVDIKDTYHERVVRPAYHAVRVAVLAVLGLVLAAALAEPAGAHPFGEPQRVELSAEGSTVTVRWSAAPDDLILLGGVVGALPNRREIVIDTNPSAPPKQVGETDADRLMGSDEVAGYLEKHVSVRQQGTRCPVDVRLDELVNGGAELVFDCPAEVGQVEIGISMLTDLHEAYRTVAIGAGTSPDRSLYTIDEDVRTWTFGVESSGRPSLATLAGWGAVGLAVAVGVTLAVRRYVRRGAR